MKSILSYIVIIGFGFSIAYNANLFGNEKISQREPIALELPKPTLPEFNSIIDLNSGDFVVHSNVPFHKTEVKVNQPIKKEVKIEYKTVPVIKTDTVIKVLVKKNNLKMLPGKIKVKKPKYPTSVHY